MEVIREYIVRADDYSHQGDHEAALAQLREALEIEPGNVSLIYSEAVCLARLGKTEQAINRYTELFSIDKKGAIASVGRFNLGNIYRRQGKFDEALVEYKKAVKNVKGLDIGEEQKRHIEADCHCGIGLSYVDRAQKGKRQSDAKEEAKRVRQELNRAKKGFEAALRKNPHNSTAEVSLTEVNDFLQRV